MEKRPDKQLPRQGDAQRGPMKNTTPNIIILIRLLTFSFNTIPLPQSPLSHTTPPRSRHYAPFFSPFSLRSMTPPPARFLPFTSLNSPYPSPPHLLSLITAFSFRVKSNNYHPIPLRKKRHLSFYPMHPSPPQAPPLTFTCPDSLSSFLSPRLRGNSLSSWGTAPGTKTLHNLFLEISQGETSLLLSDETPIRTVHVASIKLRNSRGLILIESKQLLSDGSVRQRSRPLSEKMKPMESIEEAVARAVREELGESVVVEILEGSSDVRVEERESLSYPGLRARYVLHSVEAKMVQGLPEEGEFETEETGEDELDGVGEELEGKAVTVKRHYWKWVDERDLRQ